MMTGSRFARAFEAALTVICIALMVALAVLVVIAVLVRKFDWPFGWYDEIAAIMLAWLTYYGAALAALRRAHLGFPNLVEALPPSARLAVLVVSEALVFGFFILLAWFGWRVIVLLAGDTLTSLPWMPIAVTQSVIPIGAVLFCAAEATTLSDRWREARAGGRRPIEGEAP